MTRKPLLASTVMHAGLVVLAAVGLPELWQATPEKLPAVTVELVTLADEVALSEPVPEPEPEPEPIPEPEPVPEEPARAVESPEPAPPPEEMAAPPPPQPAPQPEAKPESVPEAPEAVAAPPLPTARPEAPPEPQPEPQPEQQFTEVVESLLLDRAGEDTAPAPPQASFADVEAALASDARAAPSGEETATLAALVGRQIAERWRVPAGAAGAEQLIVTIEVALTPDGRVVKAEVKKVAGAASGELEQAVREAVLRAMNQFRYRPFRNLPPDRYDVWRHMIVRFDPSRILGT